MRVHADRSLRLARRLLQALLCALAAHAAAYGSLLPRDSIHGYLGVYEGVVAVLSAVAVGVFVLALLALMAGRERLLVSLVGRRAGRLRFGNAVGLLGGAALGVLLVQESFERSVETGNIAVASAPAVIWLNALAAIVIVATVFVLLERSCGELIRALLAGRATLPRAPARVLTPRRAPRTRRRNSLAEFRGLRAPPLLV
jgi:hypothetical protein